MSDLLQWVGTTLGPAFQKIKPHLSSVLTAGIVAALIVIFFSRGGSATPGSFKARIPPAEFVYLDGSKILNFIAELEGGEVGDIHRISKEIDSVNGKASAGPFEVGASSQHETLAESTLTQTEASKLGVLFEDLRKDGAARVSYHPLPLRNASDLARLREGMLVRFTTKYLLAPGYIRPYVVLRQSATLSALFPREPNPQISRAQQLKAEGFARQIGPDPRLTFAVSPPLSEGEGLRLLLPMHYSGLTEERSLLEKGLDDYTGGRLVVVGQVIRIFRKSSCEEDAALCPNGIAPEYTDFGTRETWRSPLEHASNYLIDHVSHNCETPRSYGETKEYRELNSDSSHLVPAITGRECFLRKLERQTKLFAPGAVIVPIAIYK
jgi:hypothetical protein